MPTPVRRLAAVEHEIGASSLWVKCDDVSGVLYGGNKPRKLEFLVADALRRRRAGLLTTGGTGTHHGLATAIAAREAGLRAVLVLLPQPLTEHVRESMLLFQAYGAELHLAESVAAMMARVARVMAMARLRGKPLALIPTGGTNALGTGAFVHAGLELGAQVRAGELPEPDAVFTAVGTGGTAAGLIAGLRLAGLRSRVVPVLVTRLLAPTEKRLARLANTAVKKMHERGETNAELQLSPAEISIRRDYLGTDYGVPTDAGNRATRLALDLEGIQLEPTYTAKAFAAFLDAAGGSGRNLLFWNTFSSIDPRRGVERLPEPAELPKPFHHFWD